MAGTTLFLSLLLLAETPAATETPVSDQPVVSNSGRTTYELRREIYDALKRSAAAAKPDPYVAAPELIGLYEELRAETRIEEFDHKRLLGLLRARLETLARQIEKSPQRGARPATIATRGEVLAQQGLPPAGVGAPAGPRGGVIGGAAGGLPDNGPVLVDLIKRTIAPNTWDDLGGPGSIYYYRPLRVLVVRQTSEVHQQLGGVLGGLRGK